ncbi:hypothetical protein BJ684DRAFT_18081, partial [Piptocephalis cylindrospora]
MSSLLTSWLPEGALAQWIFFISAVSVINTVQTYTTGTKTTRRIYSGEPQQASPLTQTLHSSPSLHSDTKKRVKSSWVKRTALFVGLSSIGLGVAALLVLYASKHASILTFLADGRSLRVSYYPFPWSRSMSHKNLPIDRVFSRQPLLPPGTQDTPGAEKGAVGKSNRFFYVACKGGW